MLMAQLCPWLVGAIGDTLLTNMSHFGNKYSKLSLTHKAFKGHLENNQVLVDKHEVTLVASS